MGISSNSDPKKVPFIPYPCSKFGYEVEIWYLHLVRVPEINLFKAI